ncbi:MAG: transcriptional regulator NrdR [Eubacteriales bacterium]|nr:transcriptional regulator NrdR [Eubacteriales bacterium]
MKCVYCNGTSSRVIDSRQTDDGMSIRRRRECESCGRRFTTYEKVDMAPLMVIKKDRSRQVFDSAKLRRGILRACEKRPVSLSDIDQLVRSIEMRAYGRADQEIRSDELGEMVMEGLKTLDEVAYVRFASVYRQFRDIQTFMDELSSLLKDQEKSAPLGG